MGVQSFLLSSTLNAVLAQRLVRKVCNDCKQESDTPDSIKTEILKILEQVEGNKTLMAKDVELAKFVKSIDKNNIKLYHGAGCNKCGNSGYRGRLGIYELLTMSDALAHAIVDNSPANIVEKISIEEGMLTLLQDGYLRVVEGSTTLEEVMRVAK
jgi:type II secretory ATPase GspE/PulE/Tfp pilus assembly ATPase PilB-like protein